MAVLIRACTYYQLINAMNIKQTFLQNEEVDLVLNQSSDFSVLKENLNQAGLFRTVFYSPDCLKENRQFHAMSFSEKTSVSKNPDRLVHLLPLSNDYSDLYLPTDDAYNKLFYYMLVKQGGNLNLHIYEDGLATYTLNIVKRVASDGMSHSYYGSQSFLNRLTEVLVYSPELYCAPVPCAVHSLPKIDSENEARKKQYVAVFGAEPMPKEPVIFFMEGFHTDHLITSDVQMLDQIAQIFGKENIIIKMHPRDQEDWLSSKGYHMFPQSKLPWEIMLLLNNVDHKLFLATSSTAVVSPQIVFGKRSTAMHLYRMRDIGTSQFLMQPLIKEYYHRLTLHLNQEEKCFFVPQNMEMLKETVRYLRSKGRI